MWGIFQIWEWLRLYSSNGARHQETNTTFALSTANQTRCMPKTTETTKFWGCRCRGFSRSGDHSSYSSNGGRLGQTRPSSHSALRIKLDACLKQWKPRCFEGVDVGNFQDLGTTEATARTEGDSNTTFALGTANQTRCMSKITETMNFWGCRCGGFSRSRKHWLQLEWRVIRTNEHHLRTRHCKPNSMHA